jgi:hypothetical protein
LQFMGWRLQISCKLSERYWVRIRDQ